MFNIKDKQVVRANAFVYVFQANEYNYAKSLWNYEDSWKKTWITKKWRSGHFFIPSGFNKPKQDFSKNEKKHKLMRNARR